MYCSQVPVLENDDPQINELLFARNFPSRKHLSILCKPYFKCNINSQHIIRQRYSKPIVAVWGAQECVTSLNLFVSNMPVADVCFRNQK